MKLKAVSGIVLTLLFIDTLAFAFNVQTVKSEYTWTETIYIRADGSVEPDTAPIASVDNITYTLTDNIVGDVPEEEYAIVVERDNIVVDGAGYILQETGVGYPGLLGIYLFNRTNVTIKNMKIKAFYHGIYLWKSSNSIISGNNITEMGWAGIGIQTCRDITISGNHVTNCNEGIGLWDSSNNTIIFRNILTNNGDGIHTYTYHLNPPSINHTIYRNDIASNGHGITLYNSHNSSIYENNITNNNLIGIYTWQSYNNTISGNNITNNGYGIIADSATFTISGNNITNNDCGIELPFFWNSTISGNNITNNTYGIKFPLDNVRWNTNFYHNNFINNTFQVQIETPYHPCISVWDIGYPSGGNYWSNYNGTDFYYGQYQNETGSDGIGDTPYVIDANNTDRHPLMGSFSDFSVTLQEETSHITTICNSEISEFQFYDTAKIISFKVTGPDYTLGFCRVDIPNDLMGPSCTAFVDGYYPEYINYGNNSTHRWIYFTYQHSTHWVIITQTPPPAVGGISLPVNKLSLLAPYIGLTILLAVAVVAVVYVKKKKRNPEIIS